jgi:hypothetical protein
MPDRRLKELGAQLVGGNLILNRVLVGKYRHGQFILEAEGQEALNEAPVPLEVAVPPAPVEPEVEAKPKRGRPSKSLDDKLSELGLD